MPHIVFEYPQNHLNDNKVDEALKAIHQAIDKSGLYKGSQVRARAYPFVLFSNGGNNEPFIHIQARIKSGRDDDNKKQLSQVILSSFKNLDIGISVITVEVIDMHRASYGKFSLSTKQGFDG